MWQAVAGIRANFVRSNQKQRGLDMSDEELLGMHTRVREELAAAYAKPSWDTAHINRITSELAVIERLLASRQVTPRCTIVRREQGPERTAPSTG
jgi:hypothetical protein